MKKLTIRMKFILSSFTVMLATVLAVSFIVAVTMRNNLQSDTHQFRNFEMENTRFHLKNYVDIAFNLITDAEQAALRGDITLEEAKALATDQIRQLRYDAGVGYFWINDLTRPYPVMVMHPTVPALNGQVLDDPKYDCAMGVGKNLFVAMLEETEETGEGFVDYLWPKPTKEGLTSDQPKLSFVKRHEGFGWIVGTGKYIDDIDKAVAAKELETEELISQLILEIFLISLAIVILAIYPILFMSRRMVAPIIACIEFADEVESGNLSGLVTYDRDDETGRLVKSLHKMVNTIRRILSGVYQHSALVVMSANKLADTSQAMTVTSKGVREKTQSVATASEKAASNLTMLSDSVVSLSRQASSISADTNEMANNVNSVATAVEQMASSFKEVAQHCAHAQQTAEKSLAMSDEAAVKINDLNDAALKIGNVVRLIEQITEQTKLLALNATIEAARAGAAGKGFSVVANEVKELAEQTAKATEGISGRIKEIQSQTGEVVRMIQEVSINNQDLNDINTNIAVTVEQQSVTTTDIATTIAGTAAGAARASGKVQEVTNVISNKITPNIQEVSSTVADVSASIQEVYLGVRKNAGAAEGNVAFAKELARVASQLRTSFGEFNLGYRKFDIGMIKAGHLAWRLHLEAMLHKGVTLSLDEIPDHTQCDFGKWLATPEAQELQSLPAYPEMIRLHEKIHELAYKIADLYHDGQQSKATSLMEEFNQTSQDLFTSLDKLYES